MTNNMRFLLLLAKQPYSSLHVKAIKNKTNSFMAQTGNLSIITEILDHSNSQPGFPAKTQKKTNKKIILQLIRIKNNSAV